MPFVHARRNNLPRIICPECKGVAVYSDTKVIRPLFHHLYNCLRCHTEIANPTVYLFCDKYGIIVRDKGSFDCFMCPVPKILKFDPKKHQCQYLQGNTIKRLNQPDMWKPSEVPYPEVVEHIEKQIRKKLLEDIKDKNEEQYERRR